MSNDSKLPTIQELADSSLGKMTELSVLLNQNPPKSWQKEHPYINLKDEKGNKVKYFYIPRERVEYILTRIFSRWWVEVKSVQLIGNSVVTIVRLYVIDPLNGDTLWNDGVGASPLQTDTGAGAIDFNKLKTSAVQMAAPSSETYAFKDAAEKFGKIFGKDLNVRDIDYNGLLALKAKKSNMDGKVELP